MANPKRKISRTRRDKRRSHHALQTPGKSLCTSCFEAEAAPPGLPALRQLQGSRGHQSRGTRLRIYGSA